MKKTLLTMGAIVLLASPSIFANEANQIRVKENVQYKYRYQTDEPKKYKGEYQPKNQYQYLHRTNMNSDPFGSGMGSMRSMGGSRSSGKR